METASLQILGEVLNYYDVLESIHLDANVSQKIYLGKEPKKCRFCIEPDVTFNNDAHAFPEFISNKFLLSHHECDTCNTHFGETVETHMANFMQVSHAVSGTKGKKNKIPKYQRSGIALNSNGNHIDIKNVDVESLSDKQFAINLTNPAFVPIAVYKCLTKMALTLIPEEELLYFSNTIDWIKEKHHNNSTYTFDKLISIYSYSPNAFPFVSAILLKRKKNVQNNFPYVIFRLTYSNFSFQSYLPLCTLDQAQSYNSDQILYVPHLTDITRGLMISEKEFVDFNVTELITTNTTRLEITNLDK